MQTDIEKLRFPIGRFQAPAGIEQVQLEKWIEEIAALPTELKQATESLNPSQWSTHYRPHGWTLRQVVNHLADSHMNSYIRFKLALTEEDPTIRPYYEDRWAETEDGKNSDPNISISLLESLHKRWVIFLRSLKPEDFERGFIHPEHGKRLVLKEVVGLYAWHGRHHLNHILQTRKLNKW